MVQFSGMTIGFDAGAWKDGLLSGKMDIGELSNGDPIVRIGIDCDTRQILFLFDKFSDWYDYIRTNRGKVSLEFVNGHNVLLEGSFNGFGRTGFSFEEICQVFANGVDTIVLRRTAHT